MCKKTETCSSNSLAPSSFVAYAFPEENICSEKKTDEFVCDDTALRSRGAILPDSVGKITSLAFISNHLSAYPLLDLATNMLDVSIQILTKNDRSDEPERFWRFHFSGSNVFPYNAVDFEQSKQLWMQDSYMVGTSEGGTVIAATLKGEGNPQPPTDFISAQNYVVLNDIDLTGFEGGNVVSSSSHIFYYAWSEQHLKEFYCKFGQNKELVKIDKKPGSAAHLDMILTPTEDIRDGKQVVFVAEAVTHKWDGSGLCEYNEDGKKSLDEIARDLSTDFYVERVPYLYTGDTVKDGGLGRIFPLEIPTAYSYNNVLMENYYKDGEHIKRVYLPKYEGKKYKDDNIKAADAYRKYGYQVIPLGNLNDIGDEHGSIRCLVKVMSRKL